MKYYFTIGVQLNRKSIIKLILLYFSVYTFYYVIQMVAQVEYDIAVGSQVLIFFNFGAAFSLLFSCLFFRHARKMSIISVWALLSVILLFLLLSTDNLYALYFLSSTIGIGLGVAAWAFSTYFVTETRIEERGRIGGLVTAMTLLTAPIFSSLARAQYAVCVVLSLLVLLTAFLNMGEHDNDRKNTKRLPLLRKHWSEFLLYFLPWLILCINNSTFIHRVDILLTEKFLEAGAYASALKYVSAGLGTLLFSILSDWIGRKPLIIGGFTMLGIAGCLAGILPNITFFLFFNIIAGFGWSFLLVAFLLIVWGELPTKELSGIYFSAGLSAYYFSKGLEPLLTPLLLISLSEAALLNACLMFISVILLVSAKSLLPSEIKERMQFKLYLEQAKRRLKQGY
jgi:MFS family permease